MASSAATIDGQFEHEINGALIYELAKRKRKKNKIKLTCLNLSLITI
jgi:hypothetical protein